MTETKLRVKRSAGIQKANIKTRQENGGTKKENKSRLFESMCDFVVPSDSFVLSPTRKLA